MATHRGARPQQARDILALRAFYTGQHRAGKRVAMDATELNLINAAMAERDRTTAVDAVTPSMLVLLDYYLERGVALRARPPSPVTTRVVRLDAATALRLANINDDDDQWFDSFVWDNASVFLNGNQDADTVDDDDAVRMRVEQLIRDRASASLFRKRLEEIASAIEQIVNHVDRNTVIDTTASTQRGGSIRVTLDGARFARVAERAYAGYDGNDEPVRQGQINGVLLANVVRLIPEVYGIPNVAWRVERGVERFEPATGSHRELMDAMHNSRRAPRRRHR